MATVAETLNLALQYHNAGNLYQAKGLYLQVLQAEPHNAEASHLFGVLCNQLGDQTTGLEWLRQAVALNPGAALYHYNLGATHQAAGQTSEALVCFQQALQLQPDTAEFCLAASNALHNLGRSAEAEAAARKAVAIQPNHPEIHNALANALYYQGKLDEALHHYLTAISLKPDHAEAHNNAGLVLAGQKKLPEAESYFRRAIQLRPDYAAAHNHLGNVLFGQNKADEALTCYRQALQLKPNFAEAVANLGAAYFDREMLNEAIACFHRAIELNTGGAEIRRRLGVAYFCQGKLAEASAHVNEAIRMQPDWAEPHYALGNVLREQNMLDEAAAHYQHALKLDPNHAEAHSYLGATLADCLQYTLAEYHCRQAVTLRPELGFAHNELGNVLRQLGKREEALTHYRQAMRLEPAMPEPHCNIGAVLASTGDLQGAMASIDEALRIRPQCDFAILDRALLQLMQGDFEQGWPGYEMRLSMRGKDHRAFPVPRWDGSALGGKTILLHAEQGLGDTLQFVRYADLVKRRGGKVIVECQPTLLGVLAGVSGIDKLVAQGAAMPPFDAHAPLNSLPGIFQTNLATIPATVPYLHVNAALVEQWRQELAGLPGFKIAIAWQGNPYFRDDQYRSMALSQFAMLASVEGVQLLSVQTGAAAEQLAAVAGQFAVKDLGGRFDLSSMADAAAVVSNVDLVITVDTVIGHLAGGLGVPVWLALPLTPDWRWLLHRDDSPWYPTMRLFRQRTLGDWDEVMARMADEVKNLM